MAEKKVPVKICKKCGSDRMKITTVHGEKCYWCPACGHRVLITAEMVIRELVIALTR